MGSSPRMRGTPVWCRRFLAEGGLIPTYAGNTTVRRYVRRCSRAHPHVCGEHLEDEYELDTLGGSSPRMRGTLHGEIPRRDKSGLIPTYAGNTLAAHRTSCGIGAHPHVCGEHADNFLESDPKTGSSPRMRGTRSWIPSRWLRGGLIPTYAGNTYSCTGCIGFREAHPHVCGEHLKDPDPPGGREGSSPRMRGTRPGDKYQPAGIGLIPTYAGNTRKSLWRWMKARAHPHVCGEHDGFAGWMEQLAGSSPRMRGTPG